MKTFNKRAAILCAGIWSGLLLLAACGKEDTSKQPMPSFEIAKKLPDLTREQYEYGLKIRKAIVGYRNLPDVKPETVKAYIAANPDYLKQDDPQYVTVSVSAIGCADELTMRFGIPFDEGLPACWQSYDVIKIQEDWTERYGEAINKLGQYLLEGK